MEREKAIFVQYYPKASVIRGARQVGKTTQDDVEKYAKNANLTRIIRTILSVGWASAGKTITN